MRDPARPDHLAPAYDSGDHLHPNDAGYKAMAAAIDLRVFGTSFLVESGQALSTAPSKGVAFAGYLFFWRAWRADGAVTRANPTALASGVRLPFQGHSRCTKPSTVCSLCQGTL